MSEILVNTIKKADGTGSLTVPAESGTVVTTASPSLGRRNVLYNGAMAIAQRSTSVTGVGNGTAYHTCDRWQILNGLTSAQFTVEQSSDAPTGFANSFKMTCTTAEATIDTSEYFFFRQRLEGYDLQGFKKGTSSAESMSVSFWIKSNKTGDIQVTFREEYNDRQIGQAVSISAANTWEYKTVVVSGDTTGTIPNSSNADFSLEFWVDAGSTYSSGSVPTSWEAYSGNTNNRGAGATLNISDATSNFIAITGVQLEVGDTASSYEHRSFGEELSLCQRYYEHTYDYGTAQGASATVGMMRFHGSTNAGGDMIFPVSFKQVKRATPTMKGYMTDGTADQWYRTRNGVNAAQSVSFYYTGTNGVCIGSSVGGAWVAANFYGHWYADAEL